MLKRYRTLQKNHFLSGEWPEESRQVKAAKDSELMWLISNRCTNEVVSDMVNRHP